MQKLIAGKHVAKKCEILRFLVNSGLPWGSKIRKKREKCMPKIMLKNACEKCEKNAVGAAGRRKARGRLAEPKRVLLVVMQVLMLVVMQVLMRLVRHAAGVRRILSLRAFRRALSYWVGGLLG